MQLQNYLMNLEMPLGKMVCFFFFFIQDFVYLLFSSFQSFSLSHVDNEPLPWDFQLPTDTPPVEGYDPLGNYQDTS